MKLRFVLLTLLLAPLLATAQAPATGRLLVATPAMDDPNYERTVILLVHHSEEGSLGLFINRPTWVDGGETFAVLEDFDADMRTLSFGGPIAMTQLLALVSAPGNLENVTEVLDHVYLTADVISFADVDPGATTHVRFFAGHTAWAPEQLQEEIDDGVWRVVAGSETLIFDSDPQELWEIATALADSGLTAATLDLH